MMAKGGFGDVLTGFCTTFAAQGLSLRGHRVLAIDIDPQGSLTTLLGATLPRAAG